jgi:hypothetical protein
VNFRAWFTEWEGNSFPGTPSSGTADGAGTGNHGDVGHQTRYNGHGASYGAPSFLSNVEKLYKLKPELRIKIGKKKV